MTEISRIEKVPKVIKDNSKIYAIAFIVVFGALFFINTFFPEFSASIGTAFFIFLMGMLVWAVSKIVWVQKRQGLDLEKILMYVLVIAGVVVVLTFKPDLIPSFSVQVAEIKTTAMSIVGVGG